MTAVVGVTPSRSTRAPSSALMNADLPELNSPTTTSRNSSSRSSSAWRSWRTSSARGRLAPTAARAAAPRTLRSSRSRSRTSSGSTPPSGCTRRGSPVIGFTCPPSCCAAAEQLACEPGDPAGHPGYPLLRRRHERCTIKAAVRRGCARQHLMHVPYRGAEASRGRRQRVTIRNSCQVSHAHA